MYKRNRRDHSLILFRTWVHFLSIIFSAIDYKETIYWIGKDGQRNEMEYHLPVFIGPNDNQIVENGDKNPIVAVPASLNSNKLNSVLLSFLAGCIICILLRWIFKKKDWCSIKACR
ncbi:hypothetical protein [Niallia sp. 01092]|uniref:hypothetical protein n=1 Tax=unclassified Niallia TaxID=2837522 RepID=UPI003FD13D06